MKTCPYCREEIKDEAIKCRYCSSMVLPMGGNERTGNDRVTYVLDRDLIRFVKFAGAILAIFLVVGAFFYGFDLNRAAETIKEARAETLAAGKETQESTREFKRYMEQAKNEVSGLVAQAKTSHEEIARASAETGQTKREIEQDKNEVSGLLERARSAVGEISETQKQIATLAQKLSALSEVTARTLRSTEDLRAAVVASSLDQPAILLTSTNDKEFSGDIMGVNFGDKQGRVYVKVTLTAQRVRPGASVLDDLKVQPLIDFSDPLSWPQYWGAESESILISGKSIKQWSNSVISLRFSSSEVMQMTNAQASLRAALVEQAGKVFGRERRYSYQVETAEGSNSAWSELVLTNSTVSANPP